MSLRSEYDTRKMRFDPFCGGTVLSSFPELASFQEFTEPDANSPVSTEQEMDELIRYALFYCCRESPIAGMRDMSEKSKLAATLAGCGEAAALDIAINGGTVRRIILKVFFLDGGYELEEFWAKKILLNNIQAYITRGIDEGADISKQITYSKSVGDVKKDIAELEERLFSNNNAATEYVLKRSVEELKGFAERQAKQYSPDKIF